jgi:hypothetical protein
LLLAIPKKQLSLKIRNRFSHQFDRVKLSSRNRQVLGPLRPPYPIDRGRFYLRGGCKQAVLKCPHPDQLGPGPDGEAGLVPNRDE